MSEEPPAQPLCLKAALDCAKRGFSVIMLHGIVDGHCTCGKPDRTSPGEHPIDSWKSAQTERASPEQLERATSPPPTPKLRSLILDPRITSSLARLATPGGTEAGWMQPTPASSPSKANARR
jgi:hypothetical protein